MVERHFSNRLLHCCPVAQTLTEFGWQEEMLDPRPSTVVVASTVERATGASLNSNKAWGAIHAVQGCRVLLLHDEEHLVQAEVLGYLGRHAARSVLHEPHLGFVCEV